MAKQLLAGVLCDGLVLHSGLLGVGRYLEIWDEARFAATCEMAENDIESLLSYVNDRYYGPGQV